MSSLDFLFIKFNGKIFFSSLSPNLNQREERERKINGKKSKKKITAVTTAVTQSYSTR